MDSPLFLRLYQLPPLLLDQILGTGGGILIRKPTTIWINRKHKDTMLLSKTILVQL